MAGAGRGATAFRSAPSCPGPAWPKAGAEAAGGPAAPWLGRSRLLVAAGQSAVPRQDRGGAQLASTAWQS